MEYEAISRAFPWTLTEVRDLPRRERDYWWKVSQKLAERR